MEALARTMHRQPVYLFVARNRIDSQAKFSANYEFYAKLGREPPELAANYSIVSTLRLPRIFSGVERLLCRLEGGMVGYISYKFCGQTAFTQDYQPKKYAREISALGYFLESIATHDLVSGLAQSISTTHSPSQSRIRQLKYVRLPIGKETDGRTWELALSSAVRRRAEKLRRQGMLQKSA